MIEGSLKVLDLSYLVEASDGDADFIEEILGDYLTEMEKYLTDLDVQFRSRDMQPLLRSAHTIKGASANIGAARVRETAAKLEAQANKGAIEGAESLIRLLRQEVRRVKELIEREGVPQLLKAVESQVRN